MALQLYQRALIEKGTNWKNEQLDGVGFDVDEEQGGWQVPSDGVLKLDYATYSMRWEQRYELDLSSTEQHAIASLLLERARREAGLNLVHPMLDGLPLDASTLEAQSPHWLVPRQGLLELDFVCRHPKHVSTRHYCLDLSDARDWLLAERLRQWAAEYVGESWLHTALDGELLPSEVEEGRCTSLELQRGGVLLATEATVAGHESDRVPYVAHGSAMRRPLAARAPLARLPHHGALSLIHI